MFQCIHLLDGSHNLRNATRMKPYYELRTTEVMTSEKAEKSHNILLLEDITVDTH